VLPGGDQHIVEAPEHNLLDEMSEPAIGAAMWAPSRERCSLDWHRHIADCHAKNQTTNTDISDNEPSPLSR
jgi:hypothetical protein